MFVTFVVGADAEPKPFTLHKETVCNQSPYCDNAFNGGSREAETHLMTLEDVDPSVFGLLLSWFYGSKIAKRKVGERKDVILSQTPVELAKLWVLAKRFQMPRLQNAVVDEIFHATDDMSRDVESLQFTGETPAQLMVPFIHFAYETEIAILQRVAVDRLAFGCSVPVFMEMVGNLPKEAVVDTAKAMRTGNELSPDNFYFAED
jgi:hypothetical protein